MDIICKDLTFQYNKNTKFSTFALNGVTLTINEGEFFGIIGHTGSGKSTFIQHLNALIPLQEGELKIGELDLNVDNGKGKKDKRKQKEVKSKLKILRKNVGMVFQYPEYQLFAETVKDDVAFGLRNLGNFTEEEIEMRVQEAVTTVGLNYGEVKDKSPFDLSGGQKRRVAIAGVIVTKPEVLVLDEPVAGLDPKGKREFFDLLHKLHASFVKTVIIVSHDMDNVAEHCSKIAIFDKGKLYKTATPAEIFTDVEELEKLGLDVPVTGYLCAQLAKKGINIDTDFTVRDFTKKIIEYKDGKR